MPRTKSSSLMAYAFEEWLWRQRPWRCTETKSGEEICGQRHLRDGEDVWMALGELTAAAGCLETTRRGFRAFIRWTGARKLSRGKKAAFQFSNGAGGRTAAPKCRYERSLAEVECTRSARTPEVLRLEMRS